MEAATADPETEGKSIEEMAGNGGEEEHEPVEYLQGTSGQLGMSVGGKSPDTSKVSIGSAARDVDGQFKKGDTVILRVIARIDEIKFADRHDSEGVAIGCTRTHTAKPLSVQVVGEAAE